MALTDRVPDVLDYLVTQAQASAALSALGVQVYDGPQPAGTTSGVEQALWIGHNPKAESEPAGSADQGFAFLDHARTKDESGEITCAAKHWTGDTDFSVHRAGCKQILAVLELMLRGDNTIGPGDSTMGGLVQWSEFAAAAWWQTLIDGGAEALCVVKISYFARLTS